MELYAPFYHPGGNVSTHYNPAPGWYWWVNFRGTSLNGGTRMTRYYNTDGTYGWKKIQISEREAWAQAKRDKIASTWHQIWRDAEKNIPPRIKYKPHWEPQKRGDTKLVDYIVGNAKDTHRIVGGRVEINKPLRILYGEHSALCRILGMVLSPKSKHPGTCNTNWLYNAMCAGAKPRDPVRRELLLKLAGPDGRKFAIEKLTELGIIHRYEV